MRERHADRARPRLPVVADARIVPRISQALRLLVHADHHGVLRGTQVQADDVADLRPELRVGEELEALGAVGSRCRPDGRPARNCGRAWPPWRDQNPVWPRARHQADVEWDVSLCCRNRCHRQAPMGSFQFGTGGCSPEPGCVHPLITASAVTTRATPPPRYRTRNCASGQQRASRTPGIFVPRDAPGSASA